MSNAGSVYTLGVWKVNQGQEAAFIDAWKDVGEVFMRLSRPPSGKGVLVQSVRDSTLFYSFGPWRSLDDSRPCAPTPRPRRASSALRLCAPRPRPEPLGWWRSRRRRGKRKSQPAQAWLCYTF
jgi:hypothetical protein